MRKIIIVGASYAGLYAARKLSSSSDVEVLLFDKNAYHYIQVEAYGYVASVYNKADVTTNTKEYIERLNKNVKFYKNSVLSFDADKKTITTDANEEFSYDKLIIATGSLTNFPPQVPNIEKYSRGIKTLQRASEVEKTFSDILAKAKNNKSDEKTVYNMAIGGAGLSGVEIAAEMANLIKESNINRSKFELNIIIVDGMKTVLPGMDERLVSSCHKRLEDLGVQIHLGSFIKDVDENKIYLMNDVVIDYDYFVFTGGVKAITIPSSKEHEVNRMNQYILNESLHLKDEEDVYVIGDAGEMELDGKYYPPTAQIAIKSGEFVASSILNNTKDAFTFKSAGVLVALGGSFSIGLANDKYYVTGFIANMMKKVVTKMHKNKFK